MNRSHDVLNGENGGREKLQRELQAELRQELLLNQAILECIPGIFYLTDESGRILRWNKELEEATGYSPREIAGMHRSDFFNEPDKSRIEQEIRKSRAAEHGRMEAQLIAKDRRKTRYMLTGRCYFTDSVGKKRHVVGVGIALENFPSVTVRREPQDREQAERVLQLLTDRQRDILQWIVLGTPNKVIARKLRISEKTVEKHRYNIMRRLGVKSAAELVRLAVVAGFDQRTPPDG